jgi:DNA-binding NarL/FixJ family response regulator
MAGESKKPAKARIYVVDDHPVVRSGLADIINQELDMLVAGEAESAEDALRDIPRVGPHLVIVDLTLKEASGLELIKALKIRHPGMLVLVLSMHDESVFAERALRAGARGYLMKNSMMGEIQGAIRQVLDGKVYLSAAMTQRMMEVVSKGKSAGADSPLGRLSDRELEVFEMIGRGLGTTEIARKLHLSVKTIDTHRASIRDKLGLKDAKQIVHHAVQWIQDL